MSLNFFASLIKFHLSDPILHRFPFSFVGRNAFAVISMFLFGKLSIRRHIWSIIIGSRVFCGSRDTFDREVQFSWCAWKLRTVRIRYRTVLLSVSSRQQSNVLIFLRSSAVYNAALMLDFDSARLFYTLQLPFELCESPFRFYDGKQPRVLSLVVEPPLLPRTTVSLCLKLLSFLLFLMRWFSSFFLCDSINL